MRPNSILYFLSLCLALVAVGIAPVGASETRRIGNTDGKPFTASCGPGMAVSGFAYNSAEQLKAVAPLCRNIDADGRTTGPVAKAGPMKGVAQGNEGKPRSCIDGQAVYRLDVAMTEYSAIYYFRAGCRGPGSAPQILKNTGINGGSEGSKGVAECQAGMVATAVVGTYADTGPKQGILSIGLSCEAPGEPKKAAAQDNPEDGDNPGDDSGNGGAKDSAGKRSAAQATTVYEQPEGDEIGYLDAGDGVSVITCDDGGQGWCQISKPMRGYVWGGDLN